MIEAADFILLAGYDPIEMRPGWQNLWDPTETTVVELLAAPGYSYMHDATMTFHAHTSEEHTSELQSRGLISYVVFCLKKNSADAEYIEDTDVDYYALDGEYAASY